MQSRTQVLTEVIVGMERDISDRHLKNERLLNSEKERDATCGEIRYIRSRIEELKASLAKGD
jgi:hypothetical protein